MSQVYEGMKDARFPGATLKDEMTEIGFVFGYRKPTLGSTSRRPCKDKNWVNPFAKLSVRRLRCLRGRRPGVHRDRRRSEPDHSAAAEGARRRRSWWTAAR